MAEREPLDFYRQVAALAEEGLRALEISAPGRERRTRALRERVRSRLQHQHEILRRLSAGELGPEQALVFLVEESAPPSAEAPAYRQYLTQLSSQLKRLASPRGKEPPRGEPEKSGEGPATQDSGGLDD